MQKYINEIIDESVIIQWKPDNRILIYSPTGSGKTKFIFTNLYEYCSKNHKKILLFSNRKALKDQNKNDLVTNQCDSDILHIHNYQEIEQWILQYHSDKEKVFDDYDFIVFDECHYFFIDSFNDKSDILLTYLHPHKTGKIYLFLSATPEPVFEIENNFDWKYELPDDYSYIEKIHYYKNEDELDSIINIIPRGEKLIYLGRAKKAYDLSKKYPDSKFICSLHNKKVGKYCQHEIFNELKQNNKFSCGNLFCTQVLDNGISIEDSDLKHIIIDQVNLIILIQFLGRKRIQNGDRIYLYIKNISKKQLNGYLSPINKAMYEVDLYFHLGKEEYLRQNKRYKLNKVFFSDGTINEAKYAYLKYQNKMISEMIKDGYDTVVCNKLNFDKNNCVFEKEENDKTYLKNLLNKYLDIHLDDIKQKQFKALFFKNKISSFHDSRSKGINVIRSIIEEMNLPYEIVSSRISDYGKRQTFWVVRRNDL